MQILENVFDMESHCLLFYNGKFQWKRNQNVKILSSCSWDLDYSNATGNKFTLINLFNMARRSMVLSDHVM